MMFGRSLQGRLLVQGASRRWFAPLRAYGKLEIAPEYVEVGCDDQPEAKTFRAWLRDGWNVLSQAPRQQALRLRQHRLVLATDGGKAWTVACIWHSGDKRSEQGSQRPYPFALFVIVPAPDRTQAEPSARGTLSCLPGFCMPLWEQMEQALPTLQASPDRAACTALIRRQTISLAEDVLAVTTDLRRAAAQMELAAWLAAVQRGPDVLEGALLRLARQLTEHRRSRGKAPDVWRVPLLPGPALEPQVVTWLRWFETNLQRPPAEFTLLWPIEDLAGSRDLSLIPRAARPEDFAGLSSEPAHVDWVQGRGVAVPSSSSAVSLAAADRLAAVLPIKQTMLDAFGGCTLPDL